MPLKNIFDSIESLQFAARINIASTVDDFLTILVNDPDYMALVDYLQAQPDHAEHILERIRYISSLQIDYTYANRLDVALCAYDWALTALVDDQNTYALARIGAELITAAPSVWWSRKIVSKVLSKLSASDNSSVTFDYLHELGHSWTFNEGSSGHGVIICGRMNDKLENAKIYWAKPGWPETFDAPPTPLDIDQQYQAVIN